MPCKVPASECSVLRRVIRLTQSRDVEDLDSRYSRPHSRASWGALTYETGSAMPPANRPFSTDRVRMLVSYSARAPSYSMSSLVGRPPTSEAKIRPRRSARGRKGRTVSDASVALTLTAKGTNSPASASRTCSAMVTPALSWASAVLAPR